MPRLNKGLLVARAQPGKTNPWYTIKAANLSADIYIYEEIGYWGVTAQDFVRELVELQTATINLHLNSPGGEVFDGVAIHGALKSHSATVNVYVDALAASAASFIAMAGDTVKIMRNAQMMIHEGWGITLGNKRDHLAMADLLGKTDANIADMYLAKAGGKLDNWIAAMEAETWYSAEEAKAAGLADEVIDSWEMSPEGVAPGGSSDDYDPEYAWHDRLAAKVAEKAIKYTGRSKAPQPYIPVKQEIRGEHGPELVSPAAGSLLPQPAAGGKPEMPDDLAIAAVIANLRNLTEVRQ